METPETTPEPDSENFPDKEGFDAEKDEGEGFDAEKDEGEGFDADKAEDESSDDSPPAGVDESDG
jgi:hypothetical protein